MNLVFASGFLIPQRILGIDYFRGLRDRIAAAGQHVALFPDVPPLDSSKERAPVLANAISAKFPEGPIHIIAHSMAGLDGRVLIGNNLNGLADRIASLTTLSTPHHGSPVADLLAGSDHAPSRIVAALDQLGIKTEALKNLTTSAAEHVPDVAKTHPRIRYRSYFVCCV